MTWTIQSLLKWSETYLRKNGIQNPVTDAQVLLAHVLGGSRIDLFVEFDRLLNAKELSVFRVLIQRRGEHEPIQYIVGYQEFWSFTFKVERGVLIPRPETECLIEKTQELFSNSPDRSLSVLDIGCGSGILAIGVAKEFPKVRVFAVDISDVALRVAKENAERHGVLDRVEFLKSDLFSEIPKGKKFDLIISNPPYIGEAQWKILDPQIRDYEPKEALVAGKEGIEIHQKILEQAIKYMCKGGAVILEIAPEQASLLNDYLTKQRIFSNIQISKDYEKRERVLVVQV